MAKDRDLHDWLAELSARAASVAGRARKRVKARSALQKLAGDRVQSLRIATGAVRAEPERQD